MVQYNALPISFIQLTVNVFQIISIGNRMNANAFRDLWARVMF